MQVNEIGYPILGDDLRDRVFGDLPRPVISGEQLNRSQDLLHKFNIQTPVDYPDNLYAGDLPFPEMQGENIAEHFEAMAGEFIDGYVE